SAARRLSTILMAPLINAPFCATSPRLVAPLAWAIFFSAPSRSMLISLWGLEADTLLSISTLWYWLTAENRFMSLSPEYLVFTFEHHARKTAQLAFQKRTC